MVRGADHRRLLVLVFVSGASSLGAEIASARLLAPYFGASTIIWANTIGTVLVALSLGYWWGGRLADRHPHEATLRLATLAAAAMLAAVPLAAGPLLDIAVGALDDLDAGAFIGSLLAVLVLVAPPLVLLGAITPWALRLAMRDVASSGEVAGRLYAVSTLGSLVGVFLAALVLIPVAGTQRTFVGFAGALAVAAVAAPRMPRRALAVPAILLAGLALPPGITKPAEGGEVLAERETPYQYARVIQRGQRRVLELNEGQAEHSVYQPGEVLTGGVWDGYATLPMAVLDSPPRHMAMLGNAAGTVSRAYGTLFPGTAIDGVEIDSEVTVIGRRYFDLGSNPRLTTFAEDARPFLRRTKRRYDLIGVDAYRQPYIPFYLTTREFFASARSRLSPNGALIVNVGHPQGDDALERVLTRTLASVYPQVRRLPLLPTNTLLIASSRPPTSARILAAIPRLPTELVPLARKTARLLGPPLNGGSVFVDDRAPVEWLIDASIVRFAAGR